MIVVRLMGGLGNQMFQYALGRHLALLNGVELRLDTSYFEHVPKDNKYFVKREYDLDIFNIKADVLDPQGSSGLPCYGRKIMHKAIHRIKRHLNLYEIIDAYKIVIERQEFKFDRTVLGAGKNVYLTGYWQNERYFKDIEGQIKDDFTYKENFNENIQKLAKEISASNALCLNIRRGDFVNNPMHGFAGTEYIYKALERIRAQADIDKIYVFSDEIDWCKQNLEFDLPCSFVDHEYAGRKFASYLYLMAQCRHFVIPNSTFGWWAAWLSKHREKIVIAPKQWLAKGGLDTSGIMPEAWSTL